MTLRYGLIAAALCLAALVVWHPARPPAIESATPLQTVSPSIADGADGRSHRRRRHDGESDEDVVYVAGAVKRPGLYRVPGGARDADAVALAGGMNASADAAGVNLAQRANDGDEIYVPAVGETRHRSSGERRTRRHATPPPDASVDVNRSGASELAAVPGIGRSIAQRIVELRRRVGDFTSLDQLLDVAGMTQSRLERARPYLREP